MAKGQFSLCTDMIADAGKSIYIRLINLFGNKNV